MAGKQGRISEEKARRIAVGATVGGVLLIVFLIIVVIVQVVMIGVRQSENNRLEEEKRYFTELNDKKQGDLEWYKTGSGLYYLARTYGWT